MGHSMYFARKLEKNEREGQIIFIDKYYTFLSFKDLSLKLIKIRGHYLYLMTLELSKHVTPITDWSSNLVHL